MARKAHDLFSLLQSRGGRGRSGRRSGGGLLGGLTALVASVLPASGGRNRDITRTRGRAPSLSGAAIAAVVFASLVIGYLLGDAFPWRSRAGSELNAAPRTAGQTPGLIHNSGELAPAEECKVLARNYLLVSVNTSDGHDRATAMGNYLRAQGLAEARSYQKWAPSGASFWCSVVYFHDDKGEAQARQRLAEIRFPADLAADVETCKNLKEGWPVAMAVE